MSQPEQQHPRRRPPLRRRHLEVLLEGTAPLLTEAQERRESALLGGREPEWQISGLTPRQMQVVELVLQGKRRREVCVLLAISPSALTRMMQRIIKRFKAGEARATRQAAIELYLEEACRRPYRPPRCCPRHRPACFYTGICPFA